GSKDVYAVVAFANPSGADPDVAVDIGSDAVRLTRRLSVFHLQLHRSELAAVLNLLAIDHVIDLDLFWRLGVVRRAGLGHVQLLVVGRETQTVWFEHLVGGDFDLSGLRVYAVHGFLDDQVALVAFVVAQAPVPGIAEPDSSIGMHYDVVWRIERLAHPFVG